MTSTFVFSLSLSLSLSTYLSYENTIPLMFRKSCLENYTNFILDKKNGFEKKNFTACDKEFNSLEKKSLVVLFTLAYRFVF